MYRHTGGQDSHSAPDKSSIRGDNLLLAGDVEGERGTVRTHVEGDGCAYHERQVQLFVTGGKTAKQRDVVRFNVLAQHRLHTFIADIVFTIGEIAQDDAFAMSEYTAHFQHVEKAVDVMVGFLHFLHEEDDVGLADFVDLGAEQRGEGGEIAAHEGARGLTENVLFVGGQLIARHLTLEQIAQQRAGLLYVDAVLLGNVAAPKRA